MIAQVLNKAKKALGIGGDADPADQQLADKASQFINEKWDDLKQAYTIYHMNVWETLLYYAGETWITWDSVRRIWYPNIPTDDWVPRPKINRFSPTIDSIATNFSSIPAIEAVPPNQLNGDERIHGINNIANAVGDDIFRRNGLDGDFNSKEDRSGSAAQLFVLAGSVFTEVSPVEVDSVQTPIMQDTELFAQQCTVCDFYEETLTPNQTCLNCNAPLTTEPVNRMQPQLDGVGNPQMQDEARYEVKICVKNPLFAYPRAGSTSMEESPFFMWAERKPLDWVWFEYNYEAEADYEFADGYSVTYEHALNYYYVGFASSTLQAKDSCLVVWCFIEPNKVKDFPDGLYAIRVNGKIIKSGTWTEFFGDHPITYGGYLQLPGIFFGRSVAFDLVNIQREKQAYEALIKLHAMTAANSPIVIDENTVTTEPSGRPDKVIKWRSIGPGAQAPKRLEHGTLDDGVYKMRESLNSEFENISGAVAVLKGAQPGSITAGSAIHDLKNQAEQMFSKPQSNWNAFWRETKRKAVRYAQRTYTHSQISEIVGPNHETDIDNFKNCGDLDDVCSWVVSGQASPRTRAERKAELLNLFDRGALDINDPNVKQNIYEVFGETGMMKMFNADATRARWENKQLMAGQPVQVKPEFEDLQVHLFIHTEQIKDLEFEKWPQPAKLAIMQHALLTKQAIQLTLQAAPPPPGEKGGGAPPPKPPTGHADKATEANVSGN